MGGGGVAPVSGVDTLVFPAGVTNLSNNNIATVPFVTSSISFTGAIAFSYSITGSQLNLSGGAITVDAAVVADISFSNPMADSSVINFTNNSANNLTLSGNITGSGAIFLTAGNLVLSGTSNGYSGGTNINGGSLSISTASNLGPGAVGIGAAILHFTGSDTYTGYPTTLAGNATFSVDGGATVNWNSNIAQSGVRSFTFQGGGNLILSGTNTYTGGTNINAGTLSVSSTSNLPSGTITIGSATLEITDTGTYTGYPTTLGGTSIFSVASGKTVNWNSNITGGANTLTLNGTGTLILSGTNSYGNTIINSGILKINGTNTSALTTVSAGATLGGTGTIIGNVNNQGNLSPGNSIGTLTINGNYTQAAGSTLTIELNPTTSDKLVVTGTTTISATNTTLALQPDPGTYSPSTTFTILDSTGAITGTFVNVTSTLPSFRGQVVYSTNLIQLIVTLVDFASIVTSPNAIATANVVDQMDPASGTDMANIISSLQQLDAPAMNAAFLMMQPSLFKGFSLTQENNNTQIAQAINRYAYNICKAYCYKDEKAKDQICKKKSYNIWVNYLGDFMTQAHRKDENKFSADTSAAMIGADYQVRNNLFLGIVSAYSYSDVDWERNLGKGQINSGYFGIYESFFTKNFFIDSSILGTANWYSGSRHVFFSTLDRNALHHNSGSGITADASIGGSVNYKECSFRPYGRGYYTYLHQKGFSENGSDSLDLRVSETNYRMARGELGFDLLRFMCYTHTQWIPSFGMSVIREVRFGGGSYVCEFYRDIPNQFTVHGLRPDRTLFSPKAGIKGSFYDDLLQISLDYIGEFGKKYRDNNVIVKMDFNF
ncbi:MAG: autotransporter domain-containing protein [Chlamydiae bacterium]|nr:autotransporter domain-containing protein [Chlamydiota bacterium]